MLSILFLHPVTILLLQHPHSRAQRDQDAAEINMQRQAALAMYAAAHSSHPSPVAFLRQLEVDTIASCGEKRARMLLGAHAGALVQQVARAHLTSGFFRCQAASSTSTSSSLSSGRSPTILEIGTFTGYSTTLLAAAWLQAARDAGNVAGRHMHRPSTVIRTSEQESTSRRRDDDAHAYGIDFDSSNLLSSGLRPVVTVDIDTQCEHWISKSPLAHLVTGMFGNSALDVLPSCKDHGPFDVVLLDADKRKQWQYLQFILDHHLLATTGVIIVDNTLFRGEVLEPASNVSAATHEFNELVMKDNRIMACVTTVRDGITFITHAFDER